MNEAKIPDPKKDTSLPGREEEVIVNSEVQHHTTNMDSGDDLVNENDSVTGNHSAIESQPDSESTGEKIFKEGMGDNSNTSTVV